MIINNLVIDEQLTGCEELRMQIAQGSRAAYLTEIEAIELMEHIVKLFDFNLEVSGCNHR